MSVSPRYNNGLQRGRRHAATPPPFRGRRGAAGGAELGRAVVIPRLEVGVGVVRAQRKERSMSTLDIWTYRSETYMQRDLPGKTVEALDGLIGKIDEATDDVGSSYIVDLSDQ